MHGACIVASYGGDDVVCVCRGGGAASVVPGMVSIYSVLFQTPFT